MSGFADRVEQQAERQRGHRSSHHYSPEQFGLTEERIHKDLGFLYDHFALG